MAQQSYAVTSQKKFLDATGLTYFSRQLNNYPSNDLLEAVINGIGDELEEKLDKTADVDTSISAASTSTNVPTSAAVAAFVEGKGYATSGANVAYDGTNKKFTKTEGSTTTDIVTAATLKTDMSLNNVENKNSATIRSELTSGNVTTALGFTPLNANQGSANSGKFLVVGSTGAIEAVTMTAWQGGSY